MNYENYNTCRLQGLTLLEMVIAMSIMAVIVAVLLPQIRATQNSWDSQSGSSEALQNGRVLMEHFSRNIASAARLTAVSDPNTTDGYIEFLDNDANTFRYDINSSNNYVEFGLVGSLSDLAGPVSELKFTCYDANDLETPITDVDSIRNVKVEVTLTNSAALGADMTISSQAYIRANTIQTSGVSKLSEPWLEYDTSMGIDSALSKIDQTHYLCAYGGFGSDGWATVLTVDSGMWSVKRQVPLEYDSSQGLSPALSQINSTHYLCVYDGKRNNGWATVLTVDTGTWTITNETPFEYDTTQGMAPALSQIDGTHYLCAYAGPADHGWATVLTVDTGTWTITNQTPYEYDNSQALTPALFQIDVAHYLCAYSGPGDDGWVTVLTVNSGTWTITKKTPFEFDTLTGQALALAQIDGTHYLCTYKADAGKGNAVVLAVDTVNWTITKGTPFGFDSVMAQTPALSQIDGTTFLCVYGGSSNQAVAVVLNVNTSDFSITKGNPVIVDASQGILPALCRIDSSYYLCAYTGSGDDGFAGILKYSDLLLP